MTLLSTYYFSGATVKTNADRFKKCFNTGRQSLSTESVFGDFMGGERWWDFKKITVTTAKQQYWKQCGRDRQCLPNPHSPFLLHKENFDSGALEGAAANTRGVRRRLWLISDPCPLSRSCWAGLTGKLAKSKHPRLVIFFCPWPFGSFRLEWAHDTGDRTKAITREGQDYRRDLRSEFLSCGAKACTAYLLTSCFTIRKPLIYSIFGVSIPSSQILKGYK